MLLLSSQGKADEGFNPAFIEQSAKGDTVADLSAFAENAGGQMPGKYLVDITVNNAVVDHREVEFYADKNEKDNNDSGLLPCLSLDDLKKYGVKIDAVPTLAKQASAAAGKDAPAEDKLCVNFLQDIPSSSSTFDFNKQLLELTFPQAVLSQSVRGYVDPELWDDGIPAFLLDYNFTGANGENKNGGARVRDDNYYLSLRSGLNFGPWRFRDYSTWNDNNGEKRWQNVNSYLQRSIISLKSQLTLGDGYSNGDVFDSVQYRGVQLASDDSMLPDSMQGFAPVVRGIAKSNAQVTISQNGYVIYQSYVSPGPFEITDLYASSGSGDLSVVVKEEDGSEQKFVQPYASVPLLQREGRLKYSVTTGKFRSGYGSSSPEFGQVSLIRGFAGGVTLYGGLQGTDNYQALALGIGKNMGDWGAISLDVTQAKTQLPHDASDTGQSYRFLYAKSIAGTATDFRLLGYRYSTKGFYTLEESVDLNSDDNDDAHSGMNGHKRSEVQGSVNQTLPEGWGSFYFTGSVQDYWGTSGTEQTLQLGYNNSWSGISYSVSMSNNFTPDEPTDRQISLSVSVPLDRWLNNAWGNYAMNSSSHGATQQQVGLSGTLDDDKFNYNVNQSLPNKDNNGSGNTSMSYKGARGNSNLGYSYTDTSRRWNYGLEGGVLVHSGGVTLAQPLGDTVTLVDAAGANDVSVVNQTGVSIDSRGYAVVPNATPYRRNRIGLDSTTFGENVEMEESAKDVIPTRGAVVRAKFNTRVGYRVMMNILRGDGKPVPFGATVSLVAKEEEDSKSANDDTDTGIVGEMGSTYLSGLPENGQLIAQWGKEAGQQCRVDYQLTEQQIKSALPTLTGRCVTATAG
ncbi:fimbrial biogenesis outer membrane usher protein [Scandinavium goeteborgense]|uniref:fimbria/pilus outer membrane usher protein n=1 Tax=Scandinavium goeteborgense TaxID=1851514 RepID=UPI002166887C|nr:fimbria/pilus outer membrane usher protein [Scandinavium goeteborgense]MCS2153788.1 fimbrial biogenesis outer membrane usher protein [Scandinavium goeteborgense]